MFNRFLVPLDGSRLAESVLPIVERLGKIIPSTVTLLHVIEKSPPTDIHGDVHLQKEPEAEEYLHSIAVRLREWGLDVHVHVHTVPQGDVAKCIAEHAAELDRDLIVLCRHGAGGMRRFVFGSNAEQVLSHGATPVLLVQAERDVGMKSFGPERILVLTEKKSSSDPALLAGMELIGYSQGAIYLLDVTPTVDTVQSEYAAAGRLTPVTTRRVLDMVAEEAQHRMRGLVEAIAANGVTVYGIIERGETAAAVVRAAKSLDCDLVVLATRGLAGLSAFWNNAITRKVAHSYDGVLLLIPRES